MKKIIGLIGPISSGKSIISDYLIKKKNASYYRFSDVLADVLKRLHLEVTRENLQSLGAALRVPFGESILADALEKDVCADENEIIIIDGIRYSDEADMIKKMGGTTVYVTADERTRYERVKARGTRGEKELTYEQFQANEMKETEKNIKAVGEKADYIIENNSTLDELMSKINEIVD